MPFSLIPCGVYDSIYDISPKALARKGIKLVLADLDNTLIPYQDTDPTPEIFAWKEALEAEGIPNVYFVWFTDGEGWKSAKRNLKETFDVLDDIYNISDMGNGIMKKLFL